MYHISQIATIVHAQPLQTSGNDLIEHLLLDSRKLLFPKTSLFFALGGPRRNGDSFIGELYHKGVRNFVVDQTFIADTAGQFPGANFLLVNNVLLALQMLAAHHRKTFQIPVIGITGSNGKTIVKEWLYQLLNDAYHIARSPKSYNSQTGVPLSIWQLNNQHTLGIFEAGISLPDEMHCLEKMIEPGIGIFTNIGDAHSEGFLNIRQKINEKLRLFVRSKLLIYHADDPDINEAVNTFNSNVRTDGGLQLFTWGKKENNVLQVLSVEKTNTQTIIRLKYNKPGQPPLHESGDESVIQQQDIIIPFTDEAAVENALHCCCVMLYLGIDLPVAAAKMLRLRPVEMRLELKKGINQCSVINDSYSADINSFTIALDFLDQQRQHPKRTVILSDILQSGRSAVTLYQDVALILAQKKIDRLIGIGPEISKQQAAFKGIPEVIFFPSSEDCRKNFHSIHFYNEAILLKGARVFEFEQISHLLEEKVHQTVLEIDLNAVAHNLKQYQQALHPGVKLMVMVKAFSYGSGSFEIANLLQFHKVDYLAVAFADEGVALRKAGISLPIMVMSAEENTFDTLVQYDLQPELFSFGIIHAFANYLQQSGIENYPVHIKLDTGMHRLGFELHDMDALTRLLQDCPMLTIQSVFSHLVASDSPMHDDFTNQQYQLFLQCCDKLQQVIQNPFLRHIANTSAILRHRKLELDMVRLGIGLYGVDSNPDMHSQLKNVTTLKTTIAQVRTVKAGESVGYNRAGIVTEDSQVATVRIGYADGYPRKLGNGNGKMLVNGQLAPVIGNVCMDMTMLNVTGISAREGDTVIVFGEDLPVIDVSKWAGTIAYEILAGISQRVKRVYYEA